MKTQTLGQAIKAKQARDKNGCWYPACGGTEKPFKVGDYTYQYMFQPSTQTHAYYCLDTDMILTDDEAYSIF